MQNEIVIYSKRSCPYCERAKMVLDQQKLRYKEVLITSYDDKDFEEMLRIAKGKTFPQILINHTAIGGYDDLIKLIKNGKLTQLLI